MQSFKQKLLFHKWAIALAFTVSIIVALPQIYFRIEHKNDGVYQGIELLPDSPWSARVREIQDGNGFGGIYYKEGKTDPYLHLPLGSAVVAYMGKLLFLDINNTLLFSRLFLSFLTTLSIYAFVYLISRDKLAALSGAALILLADAALGFEGVSRILKGISPSSFLEASRPVYSLMIFLPFFAFLISFYLFYKNNNWRLGLLSAVILGLNFYNYFYTWSYIYAFLAVLGLILLIRKEWLGIKQIVSVGLGALIVAVPYFENLYRAQLFPTYAEVSGRYGIIVSHAPLFVGFTVISSILIFLFLYPRENKKQYYFNLALLLAPFITMNQQVITGKIVQEGHYHWYFHKPIAIIFVLLSFYYFLSSKNLIFYKRIISILVVLGSIFVGLYIQAWSYFIDYPNRDGGNIAIERQKYGPVMKWLNENAKKDSVVFANNESSHMTTIYTSLNVLHHRSAQLFLAATEEKLLDTSFIFYRLTNVNQTNSRDIFKRDSKQISANIYGSYYRDMYDTYELPEEKLEKLIEKYNKTLSVPISKWLEETWKKHEVEYIIWDSIKDPLWKLDRFSFLENVAEYGNITIYRIKK